mgnify:CR=1 FL=1
MILSFALLSEKNENIISNEKNELFLFHRFFWPLVIKLTVFLFLSKMNKLMKISDNEAHSATYRSENEHFARRCRHYKSKDCKAEPVSVADHCRHRYGGWAFSRGGSSSCFIIMHFCGQTFSQAPHPQHSSFLIDITFIWLFLTFSVSLSLMS